MFLLLLLVLYEGLKNGTDGMKLMQCFSTLFFFSVSAALLQFDLPKPLYLVLGNVVNVDSEA